MDAFTFSTADLALLSTIGFFLLVQLGYYFGLYSRIYQHHKAVCNDKVPFAQELPPLSIVLCARNEAENLRRLLPALLEQDYPRFEVIVVNDASTDETEDVLGYMEEKYPNLYHSFTPQSARYISHKKLALTLGIKASKYDWLLFTEADCQPTSNQWLKLMARNFTPETDIVLGYSNYTPNKGWMHRKIAFDMLFRSMRYLGFALLRHPYMGIGRNMAYRKELFFREKGFSRHLNLQRGEDDLFVNATATRYNTRVETDLNATMQIQAPSRYKEWKEERASYRATARSYRGSQRLVAGFETCSRLLFYIACTAGVAAGIATRHWAVIGIALGAWLLRYGVQLSVFYHTGKTIDGRRRFYFSLPLFDLQQPLQSLYFSIYLLLRSKGDFMRR